MKFITVQVENEFSERYKRLCEALQSSVRVNAPGAIFELHTIPGAVAKSEREKGFLPHILKLEHYAKIMKYQTENICFIDVDTIVLKDLSHVFDFDFDIAYTERSKAASNYPLNTGVLFVKPTIGSVRFLNTWSSVDKTMIDLEALHKEYNSKYAGINQASFGYLLEKKHNYAFLESVRLRTLPCSIYNACDVANWANFDENFVSVLHIKSSLRRQCLDGWPIIYKSAVKTFKKYDSINNLTTI